MVAGIVHDIAATGCTIQTAVFGFVIDDIAARFGTIAQTVIHGMPRFVVVVVGFPAGVCL